MTARTWCTCVHTIQGKVVEVTTMLGMHPDKVDNLIKQGLSSPLQIHLTRYTASTCVQIGAGWCSAAKGKGGAKGKKTSLWNAVRLRCGPPRDRPSGCCATRHVLQCVPGAVPIYTCTRYAQYVPR